MQLGRIVGHATATVKHPTLVGWKLLLVQPLAADGSPDGEPQLAIDTLGAGRADTVVALNDGDVARKMVGAKNSPARWVVLGICDR
jgi:ethanolamine utilization protein EutN